MKKILLSVFSSALLTSSISLSTGQGVSTSIKQTENQQIQTQKFVNQEYLLYNNFNHDLSEEKLEKIAISAQKWDDKIIDQILTPALEYKNQQLVIDKSKLDVTKLPSDILNYLDLALTNLNNAVTAGYIKIEINSNNLVQLIYSSNKVSSLNDSNSDIVYFDNVDVLSQNTYSTPYMWMSTYGPSKWWKFWEWGAYLHFSEQAVQNAKWVNFAMSILNIAFFIKNIYKIINILEDLRWANSIGDTLQINKLKVNLSDAVGGIDLDLIGNFDYIIGLFTTVTSFIIAINGVPLVGQIIVAAIELTSGLVGLFTDRMISVDRGNGVKWKWRNFIINVWTFTEITAE